MKPNMFIKVSGDAFNLDAFFDYLGSKQREYHMVVCVGGGTQINEALGGSKKPHGPLGRELETLEEKQTARDALEKNQAQLQDNLSLLGIVAEVIIPVINIGSVICHVNGDQMIKTAYLGYDKLVVLTTADRLNKKKEQFKHLPKVEVLAI